MAGPPPGRGVVPTALRMALVVTGDKRLRILRQALMFQNKMLNIVASRYIHYIAYS